MMPQKDYESSFSIFLQAVVFGSSYEPSIKLVLKHDLSRKLCLIPYWLGGGGASYVIDGTGAT